MLINEDTILRNAFIKIAIESQGRENLNGDIENENMVFVIKDHNEYFDGVEKCLKYKKETTLVLVGKKIPFLHAQMLCENFCIKLITLT